MLGSEHLLRLWQAGRREGPAPVAAYDRAPHENIGPTEDEKAEAVWDRLLARLSECESATREAGKTPDSYYELCRKHRALFLAWFHMLTLYPGWWSVDLQNDTTAALARAALVMPAGPLQSAAERRVELSRAHFPVLPSSKDPVQYLRLAADPEQSSGRSAD
ncbi:unnamed protein product [Gemmata massiliana]|uniref:Uncharacterized protein n=1 Tax=Gemmata massiliana TaxID=1210884 RepID=A0A6P2CX08_9BACT|nr:hypothetical protein [Gemmata massiliana]VTR91700.1 unnamed protein product [Gemmata massiliana]